MRSGIRRAGMGAMPRRAIAERLAGVVAALCLAVVFGVLFVSLSGCAGRPKNPKEPKLINRTQLPSSNFDAVIGQFEPGNDISILGAIKTPDGVWWVRAGAYPAGGITDATSVYKILRIESSEARSMVDWWSNGFARQSTLATATIEARKVLPVDVFEALMPKEP